MREILFRGKTLTGIWVYGDLLIYNDICKIAVDDGNEEKNLYVVSSETVGQYTGLTDKNGKKIFEGDIIASGLYTYIIQIGDYEPKYIYYIINNNKHNVEKMHGVYAYCIEDETFCIIPISSKTYQKIGNMYDNPELLKED